MDHILDRSDDEDNIFFENPQTDSLQEAATKKPVRERLQCHGGEERNFLSPSRKAISEGFLVVHRARPPELATLREALSPLRAAVRTAEAC